jgi:exoribonuclease II
MFQMSVLSGAGMRHYATSRKFVGSIPDEFIEFSQFTESFQPHYGLGLTQYATEMSTRNLPAV